MHARKVFLFLAIIFSMLSGAFAQEDKIARSVSWLEGQQNADGSWSQGSRQLVDTVEVFKAFSSLNQGVTALNKALNYIAGVPETDNDKLARKLLALKGSTATVTGQLSKLASLQNADGGWGLGEKKQSSITDTILVLDALASAQNIDSQIFARGRDYLIGQQKSDGSWGAEEENAPSDVCRTSQLLCTLTAIRQAGFSSSSLEQAISKAQSFIEGKYSSGSYGNLVDTALAYLALAKLKQPAELQNTLANLTSSQAANGSWENNVYTTAVVLQALGAIQPPEEPDLPDLEVTESAISFLPEAPFAGNQVTLKAIVFNKGEIAAENVTVEFFNRDPRVGGTAIGAVQTISSIPADGSAQVQTAFDTAGLIGVQQIVVFVDRVNQIRESSEANNASAKLLTVGGVPDLKIATEDIQFSKQSPQAFEVINIVATVKNIGNTAAENVTIRFLDNNAVVTEMFLGTLGAGQQSTATLSTGLTEGQHNITVKVDPEKLVTGELITSNNEATASITAGSIPPGPPDLKIESVTFNPAAPLENQAAQIKITVSNSGGQAVTTPFQVQIKDGAAVLNTFDISSLASGQQAVLNLNTTLAAGSHAFTVTADPANVVAESDESNNSALRNLTVQSGATPVDLQISSFAVNPSTANAGDPVRISGIVHNSGTTSAGNVVVRLFDNNSPLGNDIVLKSIAGGENAVFQVTSAFAVAGSHIIKAAADPSNLITEGNENDNEATASLTVNEKPAPDLQVASITFSNNSPQAGETVRIAVKISNTGTSDSGACKLLITKGYPFISGSVAIAELDVPALARNTDAAVEAAYVPATAGTHEIYALIDSRQSVAELSETNNSLLKLLTAGGAPDLVVTADDIVFSNAAPRAFEAFNIIVTVRNTGTGNAENIPVQFWDNGEKIAEMILIGVAAGKNGKATLNTSLPAGTHSLTVKVDPAHSVAREVNVGNNEASKALAVAAPALSPADLKILSIALSPPVPLAGENVEIKVTVINQGGETAGNFNVEIKADDVLLNTFSGVSLAGGQQAVLTFSTNFTAGNHAITVNADAGNAVAESDEANNSGTTNLAVASGSTPADVQITGVSIPPDLSAGETAQMTVTVKNAGTTAAGNVVIKLYDNNIQIGNDIIIAELSGGQSTVIQFSYAFISGGQHTVKAVADPGNLVAESDEANNEAASTATLNASPLPDLVVTTSGIAASNSSPVPGETVNLNITVSNAGSQASGPFNVLVTQGNPFEPGAIFITELPVGGLAGNSSAALSARYVASAGTQNIYVLADSGQAVTEAGESNNLAGLTLSAADCPDLTADANYITFSHTDLSTGTTVSVKAMISNVGKAMSGNCMVSLVDEEQASNNKIVIGQLPVPKLQPGESYEINGVWVPRPGGHKIYLAIDTNGIVAESNENNNVVSKEVTFGGAQPAVIRIFNVTNPGNRFEASEFKAYEKVEIGVTHYWGSNVVVYVYVQDDNKNIYMPAIVNGSRIWFTTNYPPGRYDVKINILSQIPVNVYDSSLNMTFLQGNILEQKFESIYIKESHSSQVVDLKCNPKFTFKGETVSVNISADIKNESNTASNFELKASLKTPDNTLIDSTTTACSLNVDEKQKVVSLPAFSHMFNIVGDHSIELEVYHAGTRIAQKTAKFSVLEDVHVRVKRTITPQKITPDGDKKVKVNIEIEGMDHAQLQ